MAQGDTGAAPQGNGARRQFWVNIAGAAMSLGLVVGVAVWGYQLIMRDVSGIPVVRAMQGDMRVLPDDPGGDIAVHTGLAVNELIAAGEATGPEDRLILAPSAPDLPLEDLAPPAPTTAPTPAPIAAPVDQAQTSAETLPAAAPDLAPAAAPSMNTDASADDVLAMLDEIVTEQGAAANPPPRAITRAIRPVPRPARAPSAPAAAAPSAAAASGEIAVSTADFAAGTELVQLGAFSSPSVAAQEWDRLQARFGALMAGRERVIQVSNQTSGTWYRLRASGFADGDDARRFCAALQAEGAECIVVVVN